MLRKLLEEHNVATTALLANFWKHEAKAKANWAALCQEPGARPNDLFKDDLMSHFIDADVKTEAEIRLDKRMWLPLATRTRFFRREVSKSIKDKDVTQVIILGSGFDTLAVRKTKYTAEYGVKFFEIDQPPLLECKEKIYAAHQIEKNADYIGLDYVKGNLIEELKKHSVDFAKPTLILWEGNTFYLEKSDVMRILSELSTNFNKLIITFDYMHADMQSKTQKLDNASNEKSLEKTLDQFSQRKSPFKSFFEPSEIVSVCENLGIRCIDHKTAAALATEYNVDKKPYYTAETYSMITFQR